MKIKELKAQEGSLQAAEMLGLDPNTEVEFVQTVSRWTGTGYKNFIYRIVGTDDAVINYANGCGRYYDDWRMETGYFAARRSYGAACREASQKYHLPMEVCLAVSPEHCKEFAAEAAKVTYHPGGFIGSNAVGFAKVEPYVLDDGAANELDAGIGRRKMAILSLIAGCSDELRAKINAMGQKNTERVARFFAAMAANN